MSSIAVTVINTSTRMEAYEWKIEINPTLMDSCDEYQEINLSHKFNHGSLKKIEHSCAAKIYRKTEEIFVVFKLPQNIEKATATVKNIFISYQTGNTISKGREIPLSSCVQNQQNVIYGSIGLKSTEFINVNSIIIKLNIRLENEPACVNLTSYGVLENDNESRNFATFYNSSFLSDVTIIYGSDESIPAHKLILSKCSPVFYKMFDGDNMEVVENKVHIKDNPEAVERMLAWIYTGVLKEPLDLQVLIDLYKLAHRYELNVLKGTCSRKIYPQIDIDTALELGVLGMVYDDKVIMDKAVALIMGNKRVIFADAAVTAKYFEIYPDFMHRFIMED